MSFFLSDEVVGRAYKHGDGTLLPWAVKDSNKPVSLRHGLNRVPRVVNVARSDLTVDFLVINIDAEQVLGKFDAAPCNAVVRFE